MDKEDVVYIYNRIFSHTVVSDSLQPCGLKHSRLPCPLPTPRACSSSCPSVSDDIQPSHPLSSPSPPAFNLSQHQGLLRWVSSSYQVAKVLEFGSTSASVLPMTIQGWFPLGLTGLISCHKKEWEWVTCRAVDGPRVCYPEWSKVERENQIH